MRLQASALVPAAAHRTLLHSIAKSSGRILGPNSLSTRWTIAQSWLCCPQVVATRTTVDIQWQDSTFQSSAEAKSFLPVSFHDDHDFMVGDFVEERDPFADMDESPRDGPPRPPQVRS